jgi:hypothetical protein
MPRGRSNEDQAMLEMALIGYQHEREKIEGKIQELEARLKGKRAVPAQASTAKVKRAGGKRALSAAARKRIGIAQKKRWAEHRKRLAASAQA